MKQETRQIVSYFELSQEWQAEARNNLDEGYEEEKYIEPLPEQYPAKHCLLDFSDCMRTGGEYDGGWQMGNGSSIAIKIHEDNETCTLYYL